MANFQDIITIFFILGVFVFGAVLVILILNPVNEAFQNADIDQVGKDSVQDWDTQVPSVIDWFTAILFIGLPLIAFGLAFINYIPSFFYWVSFLLAIVVSVIGWIVQTLWGDLVSGQTVADAVTTIPLTNFIFSNFMIYSIIVWLLLGIGTYVKTSNSGGYY